MGRTSSHFLGAMLIGSCLAAGCQPAQNASSQPAAAPDAPSTAKDSVPSESEGASEARVLSLFGAYAPLPEWSGWCGLHKDGDRCAEGLKKAVDVQTERSRWEVRRHGWHLWAAAWAPITKEKGRNEPIEQRTNLYGTGACWSQFSDATPACSGIYPIWMTWPNTGKPHQRSTLQRVGETDAAPAAAAASSTGASSTGASKADGTTLRTKRRVHAKAAPKAAPDPTKTPTVNPDAPTYLLPPLVLSKQCRIKLEQAASWLVQKKYKEISDACTHAGAPDLFCAPAICDGTAFVNQGDVMIATESLSLEGYDDIQKSSLYSTDTLKAMYTAQAKTVSDKDTVSAKIGRRFISTKHMFWPVKGCKPGAKLGEAGCRIRYGALPPWVPKDFSHISYATNADYLGYERWKSVVAIDTCKSPGSAGPCAAGTEAKLALEYVKGARAISTKSPQVYPVDDFVHVQISEEVLKERFTPTDRALLDQATIWAYGDKSAGFEAGDFLVVAAMHVNTKELPSWTFQSVWWSPMSDSLKDCPIDQYDHCFGQAGAYGASAEPGSTKPNPYSGLTEDQIRAIDAHVGTTWRDHYVLTDSYGINYQLDGKPVTVENYFSGPAPAWATQGPSGQKLPLLPVSANVYIEPVIHPLGTDCQNCHRRAGYPSASCDPGDYSKGCGRASYQTAQCADLLGDYGDPSQDLCMTNPWAWHTAQGNACQETGGTSCKGTDALPVLDTDLIWIIADGHILPR